MFGVSLLSVIPLRSQPKETAEQVSQLIFGDTFIILKEIEEWSFIKLTFDGYEGWINKKQYVEITQEEYFVHTKSKPLYTHKPLTRVKIQNIKTFQTYYLNIPLGCRLLSKSYRINYYKIELENEELVPHYKFSISKLNETTRLFERAPYLWGGKSIFGIDCSGFTQTIFKLFDINLLRDASMQITQGVKINHLSQAQAGDLAFFNSPTGKIVHVGILLSNKEIIHASGFVRIDKIDEKGIIREEDKIYSHSLFQINRYITTA